jgi:hypothetical protein
MHDIKKVNNFTIINRGRHELPMDYVRFICGCIVTCVWIFLIKTVVCHSSGIPTSVHGSLELSYIGYAHHSEKLPHRDWGGADLKLDLSKQFSDTFTGNLKPRLRFDTAGFSSGVLNRFQDKTGQRYIFDLDEAWVRYTEDLWDITVGKNIFSWGTADGYNPTDNLNPIDGIDIPNAEKTGVFSLAFTYSGELTTLEAIIVPLFTPDRLAESDNRWSGETSDYILGESAFPDNTIKNVQFAIRFSSSTLIDGWDLTLSYYDGFDPAGIYQMGNIYSPSPVLNQKFPRIREAGIDFSTVFENIEIHGEGALRFTEDDTVDDYAEYIVGINYGADDWLLPSFAQEASIVLEYAGERVFNEKERDERYVNSGWYDRPFKDSILGSFLVKFLMDTEVEIAGGINLSDNDFFMKTTLSYKFTDTLELQVTGYIIEGEKSSSLGYWHDNDRISITVMKYF